jgi:Putative peptidoglycan binding domain
VSDRPDGPRREPALPDEDDWFATPDDWFSPQGTSTAGEPDEPLWHEEVDEPPPPPGPPGLGQRQVTVVVAVVAIVAVIALGILGVRWIGGSDSTTTTPPVTTTPITTAPPTTTAATTQTTTTTPTKTTTTGTVTEVPTGQTLRPGMTGSSVLTLQAALTQLGYDPGGADGKYGNGTTQAVKEFQAAQGLTQDGVAGPATLAAINAQLAKG